MGGGIRADRRCESSKWKRQNVVGRDDKDEGKDIKKTGAKKSGCIFFPDSSVTIDNQ